MAGDYLKIVNATPYLAMPMDNRNQLIEKNAATMIAGAAGDSAAGQLLLVNPPADFNSVDFPDGLTVHAFSQDFAVAESTSAAFGIWPTPIATTTSAQQGTDLVVIYVPKERERRQLLIAHVAQWAKRIWLVGELKGGVKAAAKQSAALGQVTKVDAARHCGLYELRPSGHYQQNYQPPTLAQVQKLYTVSAHNHLLSVVTYPGVFSFGALDAGTALLLQYLPALPNKKVLDVGCGAGVLTVVLAASGATVHAVDTNALALQATQATLAENQLEATVFPSNMLRQVSVLPHERYDVIVSNPPFHQGIATDLQPVAELIQTAKHKLKKGGQLWLVANQHLPYERWLADTFARVEQVVQNGRFKIIKAIA